MAEHRYHYYNRQCGFSQCKNVSVNIQTYLVYYKKFYQICKGCVFLHKGNGVFTHVRHDDNP